MLRVVTLEDGETIHNAFFDRGFKARPMKLHYYADTDRASQRLDLSTLETGMLPLKTA